jgi:hypothetical protein
MSVPLFFPPPQILEHVSSAGARTLRSLLAEAGAPCRASGPFTERPIRVIAGEPGLLQKEPGDWTVVVVGVPSGLSERDAARHAAAVLAYGLMDVVARESLRGLPWAKPAPPRGRPRRGEAVSNRERQRAHRQRRG